MNTALLPVLVPLITALVALIIGRASFFRRSLFVLSAVAQVGIAIYIFSIVRRDGMLVVVPGDWLPPFGIVIALDLLSAIMICLATITTLGAVLYGILEMRSRLQHPLRLPLMQLLLVGINLSFCTGDLFNLFVAFEVMLVASYALLTLEADDWDVRHAYPYLSMNMIGSGLFLAGAGLAYSLFGTLNFADIAVRSREMGDDPRILLLALLFCAVFATKSGLFPLYFWLPNSYPTLPIPVVALFSGMLTKVGIYVLLRIFGTVLPHDLHGVHYLIAWLAAATMILGVFGAVSRNFIRGILSFHILSQVGFIVLAVGLFTPLSLAGAIFYIVHHIIVKSSLFLIGGVGALLNKTDDLSRMNNLWKYVPLLGVLFLIQALSLAGVPPLSGFWGKYVIILEGVRLGEYALVAASVVASILTLFSMLKIWYGAFWAHSGELRLLLTDKRWPGLTAVIAGLTVLSLCIGFGAQYFLVVSDEAAKSLLDWRGYADRVFAVQGKGAL